MGFGVHVCVRVFKPSEKTLASPPLSQRGNALLFSVQPGLFSLSGWESEPLILIQKGGWELGGVEEDRMEGSTLLVEALWKPLFMPCFFRSHPITLPSILPPSQTGFRAGLRAASTPAADKRARAAACTFTPAFMTLQRISGKKSPRKEKKGEKKKTLRKQGKHKHRGFQFRFHSY